MILPEKVFPAARELEERFPALRAEIDALLEKRTIPAYGAFDPVRAAQVSEEWKLYYAYMYGQSNELARDEVPTLLSFAQSRPEVVNAFVSILDPGVELPPHKDPYAGVLRYHLGVRVPREEPAAHPPRPGPAHLEGGEGRVLDVSVEHEVVNTSEEPRVVVIIDFRRPMGFFASALNRYMLRLKRKWAPQFVEASRYDVMHAA